MKINIKKLSDADIWRIIQMPEYRNIPEDIKVLKKKAEKEFKQRNIKLRFIVSAMPGS